MGLFNFLSFVRWACPSAIVPSLTDTGRLSTDYSSLRPQLLRIDAVIFEMMHKMHAVAARCPDTASLSLFFQRLMEVTIGSACAIERVSTIVLLFDNGVHPMKSSCSDTRSTSMRKRMESTPSFHNHWFSSPERRAKLLDELRVWLCENISVRAGLNVVVHGLWREPAVFWRDENDNRHMSAPYERGLATSLIQWPTTCYEADDLVTLWVKLLLYPPGCDATANNMMIVANDSDILANLLLHMSLLNALPASKKPQPKDGPDADIVMLFKNKCIAGHKEGLPPGASEKVEAAEYVAVLPTMCLLQATFEPAMIRWVGARNNINPTLLGILSLWLCDKHDYYATKWLPRGGDISYWFPYFVRALVADDISQALVVGYARDPGVWEPLEVKVCGTAFRDGILQLKNFAQLEGKRQILTTVVDAQGSSRSIDNLSTQIYMATRNPTLHITPQESEYYHAQAARLAYWLAMRLNNAQPGWRDGRGLPSEVEQQDGLSLWGYAMIDGQCKPINEGIKKRESYWVPNE